MKRRGFELKDSEVEAVKLDGETTLTGSSDTDLKAADALADEDGLASVVDASETGDSTNRLVARIRREPDAAIARGRGAIEISGSLHPDGFVGAHVVELLAPEIRDSLLSFRCPCRIGFHLIGHVCVHALMGAVVLGVGGTAERDPDAQGRPPG